MSELKKVSDVIRSEITGLTEAIQHERESRSMSQDEFQEFIGGRLRERIKQDGEQRKAEIIRTRLNSCGLTTEQILDMTFGRFDIDHDNKSVYDKCKVFADTYPDVKKGLLIMGKQSGIGKTHLSAAITQSVIKKGYLARFINITTLIQEMLNSYKYDSMVDPIASLLEYDVIVLDDLGEEQDKEHIHQALYRLIDGVIGTDKRLVITTNLTGAEMDKRYDKRTLSRLLGLCDWFQYSGKDRR